MARGPHTMRTDPRDAAHICARLVPSARSRGHLDKLACVDSLQINPKPADWSCAAITPAYSLHALLDWRKPQRGLEEVTFGVTENTQLSRSSLVLLALLIACSETVIDMACLHVDQMAYIMKCGHVCSTVCHGYQVAQLSCSCI